MQQIVIVDTDFITAPAEIVAEVACQSTLDGNVRRERSNGDVVSVDRSERTIIVGSGGVEESVMIEIVAPWSLAVIFKPCQQR